MEAYSGRWYEIARLPLVWEKDCSQATADYHLVGEALQVTNTCYQDNIIVGQSFGVAYPTTHLDSFPSLDSFPLKFKLRFGDGPVSDYWIEDTDFITYSIVGGPTQQYLWLLSRKPFVSYSVFSYFLHQSQALGYSLHNLQITGSILPP